MKLKSTKTNVSNKNNSLVTKKTLYTYIEHKLVLLSIRHKNND